MVKWLKEVLRSTQSGLSRSWTKSCAWVSSKEALISAYIHPLGPIRPNFLKGLLDVNLAILVISSLAFSVLWVLSKFQLFNKNEFLVMFCCALSVLWSLIILLLITLPAVWYQCYRGNFKEAQIKLGHQPDNIERLYLRSFAKTASRNIEAILFPGFILGLVITNIVRGSNVVEVAYLLLVVMLLGGGAAYVVIFENSYFNSKYQVLMEKLCKFLDKHNFSTRARFQRLPENVQQEVNDCIASLGDHQAAAWTRRMAVRHAKSVIGSKGEQK